MKKNFCKVFFMLFTFVSIAGALLATELTAEITDITKNPYAFDGKEVKMSGFFSMWKNAPGAPPISRSDWVLCDSSKNGIYCYGSMPSDEETGEIESFWKPIDVIGTVRIKDGKPFIAVKSVAVSIKKIERMVSTQQIILNQDKMMGEYVGIMGVLAKGHGIKGDRMYLIADPTGAIRIGRMPKLYPKGTILHIKGVVTSDEYGIPMIDQIEIVSAKVD